MQQTFFLRLCLP